MSSRNVKDDKMINSSRDNEHFSFGAATENNLKMKVHKHAKVKTKEAMTERSKT